VTISAPLAAMAAARDALDGNFPVPSRSREENSRPAMISGSDIGLSLARIVELV
jgi:hypothetical protein